MSRSDNVGTSCFYNLVIVCMMVPVKKKNRDTFGKLGLSLSLVDAELYLRGRGKELVGKGLDTVRARLATVCSRLVIACATLASVRF